MCFRDRLHCGFLDLEPERFYHRGLDGNLKTASVKLFGLYAENTAVRPSP